jgi:hypothetical protein
MVGADNRPMAVISHRAESLSPFSSVSYQLRVEPL